MLTSSTLIKWLGGCVPSVQNSAFPNSSPFLRHVSRDLEKNQEHHGTSTYFPSLYIFFWFSTIFLGSNAKSTWPAALSGSAAPASSTPWSQRKNHWMWMDWDTKNLDFWPTQWDKYETYMAYIWGIYIYVSIIYPGYHVWWGNYMNTGHQRMDWIEDLHETKVLLSNMDGFLRNFPPTISGKTGKWFDFLWTVLKKPWRFSPCKYAGLNFLDFSSFDDRD